MGGKTTTEIIGTFSAARPGDTIRVHVNPHDPREAVIDPGVDQAAVLSTLLIGLLFALYGGWLLARVFGLPQ